VPSRVPERYNERDLTFSGWHRTLHAFLPMQDLDCVEYCHRCYVPLALVELALDVGQEKKKFTKPLIKLAERARVPAYLAFYTKDEKEKVKAISIRRLYPQKTKDIILTPAQYELFLKMLRIRHGGPCFENVPVSFWEISSTAEDHIAISPLL